MAIAGEMSGIRYILNEGFRRRLLSRKEKSQVGFHEDV